MINGHVPIDWKTVSLGEILTLGSGRDYKHLEKGNIPVYGTGGYMTSVDEYLYDGESVGIGRKGTIDKPVLLKGKFWTVDTLFYTHSFKNVIPFYVYLLFQSINWRRFSEATGVPSLSKNIIEPIKILLPPLPEQQKIAEILSTVDAKIEVIDQQITETQELKKGLMQRLLTKGIGHTEFKNSPLGKIPKSWEVATFKDYTKVNQGLQIPISKRLKRKIENSFRYITIQFIKKPDDISNIYYVDSPQKSVVCGKDEILMTRTGNTGIVVTNVEGVFHNNFFKVDFNRKELTKDFMFYYLNSSPIQKIIALKAGGTTIQDLNHGDFYKIPLLKPSLEEQQNIAEILSSVDEKLEVLLEKKTNHQELKKGLMQQLLTGRVRVKLNSNVSV